MGQATSTQNGVPTVLPSAIVELKDKDKINFNLNLEKETSILDTIGSSSSISIKTSKKEVHVASSASPPTSSLFSFYNDSLSPTLSSTPPDSEATDRRNSNEDDLSITAGSGRTLMSGWLQKQTVQRGGTALVKLIASNNTTPWKPRFFVLRRGCLYYYIDSVEDSFKAKSGGSLTYKATCISRVPIRLPGTSKIGYEFTLQVDNKLFHLAAFSENELDAWLNFLNDLPPNGTKEGWLVLKFTVKGWYNTTDKWEIRWFSATKETFKFSKRVQHGIFPLAGSTVEEIFDEFSFSIASPTSTLNLKAESAESRAIWMDLITKEIERLEKTNEILTDPIELELSNLIRDFLEHQKLEDSKFNEMYQQQQQYEFKKDPNTLYILSIDGGGMRGIITTIILERIVQRFPDFLDKIDFVSGCSNGGMVAMALAFGRNPRFCRALLEMAGHVIFQTSVLSNKMNHAKFGNSHLKFLCEMIFKDSKIKDAKKKLVIPAFLMDNQSQEISARSSEPRIFHNLNSDTNPLADELAVDVVMRTGAAPTFFPSYQQYVDGGMFAHDPASLATTLAISPKWEFKKRPENIVLLSLGTGHVNHYYDDPNHNWGYVQWVPKLGDCFWDGMLKKSELLCREILDDRYHRLDPIFDKEIPMDDPQQIPTLTEIAKNLDITETLLWIQKHFYSDEFIDTFPKDGHDVVHSVEKPLAHIP